MPHITSYHEITLAEMLLDWLQNERRGKVTS